MIKNNKNVNKVFILLLVISVLLISLRITPTILAIKQIAYSILVPDIKLSSNIFSKTGSFLLTLSNIININQENIELKNKRIELTQQLTNYELILEDNARLKQLLNIKETKNLKPIFANIIVREPNQWYKLVIIDKGSDDGIQKDNPVVAVLPNGQTCVFGRIVETYSSTSKVALVTNPLFSFPVNIKETTIDCVCEGNDSQYLKLSFIPQNTELKINQEVTTSPLSEIFDRGIIVGKIVDITKTNYGDYQEVLVEPYSQTESIYEVAVLLKK